MSLTKPIIFPASPILSPGHHQLPTNPPHILPAPQSFKKPNHQAPMHQNPPKDQRQNQKMSFQAGGLPGTAFATRVAATSGAQLPPAQFPGSAALAAGASLTLASLTEHWQH